MLKLHCVSGSHLRPPEAPLVSRMQSCPPECGLGDADFKYRFMETSLLTVDPMDPCWFNVLFISLTTTRDVQEFDSRLVVAGDAGSRLAENGRWLPKIQPAAYGRRGLFGPKSWCQQGLHAQ